MRNTSLLLFCLLVTLAPMGVGQTSHRRPSPKTQGDASSALEDRAAIQELDDKEIKANLGLDVKAMELLWDPEIISMPPGHAAISGLEANRVYLEEVAKQMENFQILGYEQAWQEVRIIGDYAYEFGTVQTRVGPMNPGPEVDTTYNMMRILKKQPDGAWRVYRAIWNNASPPKSTEKAPETPEQKPPAEDRMH
jgi:ketosteroid isomerase-like protein